MINVHPFPIKKRNKVFEYETCGGCKEVIPDDPQGCMEIVMPLDDYDKHIVLCSLCAISAKRHGVFK